MVLNYDPNNIEKYIKGNADMLQYSLSHSNEFSMIKEELSKKSYFVEQVDEANGSNNLNFDGQPFTEALESFENQTVIHMPNSDNETFFEEKTDHLVLDKVNEGTETYLNEITLETITEGTKLDLNNQTIIQMTNLDKEMVLEEKTDLAPKQELFGYNFVDKAQVDITSEINNEDVKIDFGSLEDPNVRDENIASFDEKTKKFLCTKCDVSFTRKGMVKYHFAKVHKENNKMSFRCRFAVAESYPKLI